MVDMEGHFVLAFNGEIYNFRGLREELQGLGHVFHTGTDTEVILRAWHAWGNQALQRFNGFFALALYDVHSQTLFVARDRMGIKPLLWFEGDGFVAFGSEMKALYALGVQRDIDVVALYHYLQLNYLPGNAGIYQGVRSLPPGASLLISSEGIKQYQWWTPPADEEVGQSVPDRYEDAQTVLEQKLEAAVQARLVSDVPLGAFLSGGIDSSVMVALASRFVDKLQTFSVGYKDEPFFDETKHAQRVADRYQTDHRVFSLTNDDLYEGLDDTLDQMDQPFADSSALAVGILSRETRKHVTVALSGDGADELFGGYYKHMAHLRAASGGILPALVDIGRPLWNALPKSRQNPIGNRIRQLNRFAEGRTLSPADRYWRWCALASSSEAITLLHPVWRERLRTQQEVERNRRQALLNAFIGEHDPLQAVLQSDQGLVLPGDMLHKVDHMSMAHGLEVRVPFMDHHVVAYANALPPNWKIEAGLKKRILQDAFRSHLPEALYKRPKHGFEVPLLGWFQGPLKDRILNHWLEPARIHAQGIFNPEAIAALRRKLFSKDPGEVQGRIWGLIVFQHWWDRWHNSANR
jgi:asparagine synthase (glutamine-hydrolysing)